MPVPVHELATTEQFLPVLDGHETVSPPASGSPTTTAATWCWRCWPSARAASASTSWSATRSASPRAWSTPRSCAPTSSRDAPPWATSPSTDCGRTCSISRCSATATAASTRPPPTSVPSGSRSSPDGSCRRSWSPRWCDRAATGRRSPSATDSGSISTRRAMRSGSRGRRGRVVRQPAPALDLDHLHGHLELVGGRLADRHAAPRPARHVTPRCGLAPGGRPPVKGGRSRGTAWVYDR